MARIKLDLPERFAFSTDLPVRITDINYGQHLGNDAVFAFLHEARVRFLQSHGLSEVDVGGCGLIMTDAVIVYKAQAKQGDLLRCEVAVQDPGPLGCDLVYRLTRAADGVEIARGKTGVVCFDYARGRPVRAPEPFLRACAPRATAQEA
jgi:acyl-CoA thioesterase FadM